jgi:hypothetical protein
MNEMGLLTDVPDSAAIERIWVGTRVSMQRHRMRLRSWIIIAIAAALVAGTGTAAYAASGMFVQHLRR